MDIDPRCCIHRPESPARVERFRLDHARERLRKLSQSFGKAGAARSEGKSIGLQWENDPFSSFIINFVIIIVFIYV